MTSSREQAAVELVDEMGRPTGSATVAEAHSAPGRLHRAFSVILFDDAGNMLIQQRASGKTRFPLRWANACCGHPAPGQPVLAAAARRLQEELGLTVALTEVGTYTYAASDPATGRVEREYDHVVVGRMPDGLDIAADPAEVAATRWIAASSLAAEATSDQYAPWLHGVVGVALNAIRLP